MRLPYVDLVVYRANDATFRFVFEDQNSEIPRTPHDFREGSRFYFTARRASRYAGRPDTDTTAVERIAKESPIGGLRYDPENRSLYLYLTPEDTEDVTRNERYDFECDVITPASNGSNPTSADSPGSRQTLFRGSLEVRYTENLNGNAANESNLNGGTS